MASPQTNTVIALQGRKGQPETLSQCGKVNNNNTLLLVMGIPG